MTMNHLLAFWESNLWLSDCRWQIQRFKHKHAFAPHFFFQTRETAPLWVVTTGQCKVECVVKNGIAVLIVKRQVNAMSVD